MQGIGGGAVGIPRPSRGGGGGSLGHRLLRTLAAPGLRIRAPDLLGGALRSCPRPSDGAPGWDSGLLELMSNWGSAETGSEVSRKGRMAPESPAAAAACRALEPEGARLDPRAGGEIGKRKD